MWMLFSGHDEKGVGEWERRLRDLEKSYKRLYPGDLGGYSVEEEITRFKVRLIYSSLHAHATSVRCFLT